ncbi:MAG: CBS domain-containing protein [Dehalococcoidales bacterium]|nr:MAG: CBS domain-containing protein [Dehalococcoidales bacterium]
MVNSSTKVRICLEMKGHRLITIGPDDTVETAIRKLVDNKIGAMPVCDRQGNLIGIVSERDLLKECSQRAKRISKTPVKDVMTKDVVIGIMDDDLDYVMDIMTQKGIRHLPIMDGPTLKGMVSIRDAVDIQLEKSKGEVRFLNTYISGGYH